MVIIMHEKYMELAIREAKKAYKNGDVPIGAIIIKNNKIISKAFNKKQKNRNAIEHAEIIAIEKACKKLKSWHLEECTLYTTVEPCMMCCGAIIQSRITNLVYGTKNPKFGYVDSLDNLLNDKKNNHKVNVIKSIKENESRDLIVSFFKSKRK